MRRDERRLNGGDDDGDGDGEGNNSYRYKVPSALSLYERSVLRVLRVPYAFL